MITEVEGNLLKDIQPYSVLLHQVNCVGTMGAGLALQMAKKFDGMYKAYREHCSWFQKDWTGKTHYDELLGTWFRWQPKEDLIVCNAFGQKLWSREGKMTDYDAWDKIFSKLVLQTLRVNKGRPPEKQWKIHAPYGLGCGLGGGDWDEMSQLIEKHFGDTAVELIIHKM